jgi:hypothetical protein
MDNIFLIALLISFIFFITKFLEMRYIEKQPKPLKYLIRDSLLVYISVVIGYFVVEQLKPVVQKVVNPLAFTDNPPF